MFAQAWTLPLLLLWPAGVPFWTGFERQGWSSPQFGCAVMGGSLPR